MLYDEAKIGKVRMPPSSIYNWYCAARSLYHITSRTALIRVTACATHDKRSNLSRKQTPHYAVSRRERVSETSSITYERPLPPKRSVSKESSQAPPPTVRLSVNRNLQSKGESLLCSPKAPPTFESNAECRVEDDVARSISDSPVLRMSPVPASTIGRLFHYGGRLFVGNITI